MTPDASRPRAIDRVQPQRDRLRDAHVAFERVCQQPDASTAAAIEALGALREAFAEHVAFTEGPSGLFEEMQDDAPLEAANEVDRLRRDHITINGVIDRADKSLRADAARIDDEHVQEEIAELVRLITQHRRRGMELS
jgi:hypothetical protein